MKKLSSSIESVKQSTTKKRIVLGLGLTGLAAIGVAAYANTNPTSHRSVPTVSAEAPTLPSTTLNVAPSTTSTTEAVPTTIAVPARAITPSTIAKPLVTTTTTAAPRPANSGYYVGETIDVIGNSVFILNPSVPMRAEPSANSAPVKGDNFKAELPQVFGQSLGGYACFAYASSPTHEACINLDDPNTTNSLQVGVYAPGSTIPTWKSYEQGKSQMQIRAAHIDQVDNYKPYEANNPNNPFDNSATGQAPVAQTVTSGGAD